MSTYVSNRNGGGSTDEQGHYRFQTKVFKGNVLSGLKVVQNSPLARNVLVPAGDLKIDYGEYAYTAWNDANVTVSLNTADTTNPRLDRIVAYIDRSLTSGGTNNPGYLKFMAIAGTPGAVPTKASDVATQAAVTAAAGAVASPWVELAVVRVEANATTIPDSKITDSRVMVYSDLQVPAYDARFAAMNAVYNYFESGVVMSALTGLNFAVSAGIVFINGVRVVVPAVASFTVVASRDTYYYVGLDGVVTAATAVLNNGNSPALPANCVWVGRVISGASVTYLDQHTVDTNGNFICPRAIGTSRAFQFGATDQWRVLDEGQTRVYTTKTTVASENVAASSNGTGRTSSAPFINTLSANACHSTRDWTGGFTDQTLVHGQINTGLGATYWFKNLYSGGTLTFSNGIVSRQLRFLNGVTTY